MNDIKQALRDEEERVGNLTGSHGTAKVRELRDHLEAEREKAREWRDDLQTDLAEAPSHLHAAAPPRPTPGGGTRTQVRSGAVVAATGASFPAPDAPVGFAGRARLRGRRREPPSRLGRRLMQPTRGRAVSGYDRLGAERPRTVRDHTEKWQRLRTLTRRRRQARAVAAFCASKRITVDALAQLSHGRKPGRPRAVPRLRGHQRRRPDHRDQVPAARRDVARQLRRAALDLAAADRDRRPDVARLADRRGRDRRRPAVRARRRPLRDPGAARRRAHVPARVGGPDPARARRSRSATTPTRTATRAPRRPRRIIGGRTVRVRPPIEGGDWCDWAGDARRVRQARPAARPLRVRQLRRLRRARSSRSPSRCSASRARCSSPPGRC